MNYMRILFIMACFCCLFLQGKAQMKNTAFEVKDYKEVDGKIILEMVVNGVYADFVLDVAGHNAILPEYLEKLNIDTTRRGRFPYNKFQYKDVGTTRTVLINSISFGNNVFGNEVSAFVLKDEPYLRKLGVAGVIGGTLFQNVVLTIDSRRKKITTSIPYRPTYMRLDRRENMELIAGAAIVCPITIDNAVYSLLLDTWNSGLIILNKAEFEKLGGKEVENTYISEGYGESVKMGRSKLVSTCRFVKENFSDVDVIENTTLARSVIGTDILKKGLLSIDFGKRKVYFQPFDLVPVKDEIEGNEAVVIEAGKLNPITRDYFLEHIYDYRTGKEFIFKGDKPVVIDFWATWCGPCMKLIPEMEKLAEKYKDRVIFLKVNADKEKELCTMFNVNALPTLFFIPVGGKPIIEVGAIPEKFEQIIEEKLLK